MLKKSIIRCYVALLQKCFKFKKRIIYFGFNFFSCGNCWVKFEKKNPGKSLDLNSIKQSIKVIQIRFSLLCIFRGWWNRVHVREELRGTLVRAKAKDIPYIPNLWRFRVMPLRSDNNKPHVPRSCFIAPHFQLLEAWGVSTQAFEQQAMSLLQECMYVVVFSTEGGCTSITCGIEGWHFAPLTWLPYSYQ